MGYVVDLGEIDETQMALAGGKGANLGALSRIDGIRVPPGFCVTRSARVPSWRACAPTRRGIAIARWRSARPSCPSRSSARCVRRRA